MDSSHQTFVGHNGTLIVKPDGVTIKRSFSQALSTGHPTNREVNIPYQHLEKVMHQRASSSLGYLQFATKPGTPGHSAMHRTSKIHFGNHHAHEFTRAKEMIETHVRDQQELSTKSQESDDTSNPKVNPFTGEEIS